MTHTRYLPIAISALCLVLTGCGAGDVSYVSRGELKSDPLYLIGRSDMENQPTNYGAIKFKQDDDMDHEGRLFLLQKKKGVYQTETLLMTHNDKRYYFSVGVNYKQKSPMVGLRIEF